MQRLTTLSSKTAAALSALALSLVLISGTVSMPQGAAVAASNYAGVLA